MKNWISRVLNELFYAGLFYFLKKIFIQFYFMDIWEFEPRRRNLLKINFDGNIGILWRIRKHSPIAVLWQKFSTQFSLIILYLMIYNALSLERKYYSPLSGGCWENSLYFYRKTFQLFHKFLNNLLACCFWC